MVTPEIPEFYAASPIPSLPVLVNELSPLERRTFCGFGVCDQDAIDTAAESGDTTLAEDLLSFFVNIGDKECFCAALYTCYALIRPDVAMELAWRNK